MKNKILTIFLLTITIFVYSQMNIQKIDNIASEEISKHSMGIILQNIFSIGVFFILCIIHLSLFLGYKKQKANLYFFIASISAVISWIFYTFSFYKSNYLINTTNLLIWSSVTGTISSLFLFVAIHTLLKVKREKTFYLIFGFSIFVIFFQLFFDVLGGFLSFFLLIFSRIEALRLSIKSYRMGNKTFGIVVFGLAIFLVLFIILYFMNSGVLLNPIINDYFELKDLGALFCILPIPVCISIYLCREFGYNSVNLEKQLLQVQQLSTEKQETLQKQNAELQAALLKGQTTERQRVAIDLHDNLGSTISSIKYSLEAIDRSKMNADEVAVQENLYSLLDKAYNDVRLLSHNLLPEEFEKLGLAETLATLVRKMNKSSKIKFELEVDENIGRLDKKVEFELYSICLELVNNIMKHSKATEAKIVLISTEKSKITTDLTPPLGVGGPNKTLVEGLAPQPPKGEQISLTVSDNGIGTFKNDSDGRGMKNIQARVDSINGTWTVKSIEGEGVVNEIVV